MAFRHADCFRQAFASTSSHFQATLIEPPARFVFHHNLDTPVAKTLRQAAEQHGRRALMFGRVPDLERFVLASDLVLTSPSDPLLVETLALNRPLLLLGKDGPAEEQVRFGLEMASR